MQKISIFKDKEIVKHNLVLDVDMYFFFKKKLIPRVTMAKNINSMDL